MSTQGNDAGGADEQTERAAEKSDEVGSYSSEQFPEDPEAGTAAGGNERASEPPKSG